MSQFQPKSAFFTLADKLFSSLNSSEDLTLSLTAEQSSFMRLNAAQVRQNTHVIDGILGLTLFTDGKSSSYHVPLTGHVEQDHQICQKALGELRQTLPQLSEDPYLVLPKDFGTSEQEQKGDFVNSIELTDKICSATKGHDFTGLVTAGDVFRGFANSKGSKHWFASENFIVDYSLIGENDRMVKGLYAGREWDDRTFNSQIESAIKKLEVMSRTPRNIERGAYRTYLAPASLREIMETVSYGGLSEGAFRQGGCPLKRLHQKEASLSNKFSLQENFTLDLSPRFNHQGEVAPETLALISEGKLTQSLVSERTAKEYGIKGNGASASESLRSCEVLPGSLQEDDIVKELGEGLYLSNLHYLNWSDPNGGRITGMTRYACFWVENGEIAAPIENLRFDDTVYNLLGDELEELTDFQEVFLETSSYEYRHLGGYQLPGALIRNMQFTL